MNWAIIKNTCKEKLRKKDWIILSIVMILLFLFFSSSNSTLTVAGREITDIKTMFPYFMLASSIVCGFASIIMSAGTIPVEYERKNSYLIWARKISQTKYHISLAVGNSFACIAATLVCYLTAVLLLFIKNEAMMLFCLPISFFLTLLVCLSLTFLTSALSVILPSPAVILITSLLFVLGTVKNILSMLLLTMDGGATAILRVLVRLIPNYYDMMEQSVIFIQNQKIDIHLLFTVLLLQYFALVLLIVLRRKEA